MPQETYQRPSWVLPGEQWSVGQTQLQYEQSGGQLASGVASVIPPPAPPPETLLATRYEDPLSAKEKAYYEGLDITAPTPGEEVTTRENIRQQMQAQIDAVNEMYGRLVAGEQQLGVERLGRTKAIASRAGILESPMGEAQLTRTEEYTKEQVKNIEAERNLKVQAVLGRIDERATEEIRLKKVETAANIEKYFNYLKGVKEEAKSDAKELAMAGTSLTTLKANKEYYDQLRLETGMPEFVFDSIYNQNLDAALKIDYTYSWKGDNLVAIGIDPKTGTLKTMTYKAEELGIPKDVDFEIIINDLTGEVFWFDKANPSAGIKKVGEVEARKAETEIKPELKQLDTGEWAWIYPDGRVVKTGEKGKMKDWAESTATEKSKALKWLYKQPGYTDADIEKLKTDSEFFYWVLGEVEGEEEGYLGKPK